MLSIVFSDDWVCEMLMLHLGTIMSHESETFWLTTKNIYATRT